MLCGPESFFQKAVDILPWSDDEIDTAAIQPQRQEGRDGISVVNTDLAIYDMNPRAPLDSLWREGPLRMGVTISTCPPSTTAGKILRHCKDRGAGSKSHDMRMQGGKPLLHATGS